MDPLHFNIDHAVIYVHRVGSGFGSAEFLLPVETDEQVNGYVAPRCRIERCWSKCPLWNPWLRPVRGDYFMAIGNHAIFKWQSHISAHIALESRLANDQAGGLGFLQRPQTTRGVNWSHHAFRMASQVSASESGSVLFCNFPSDYSLQTQSRPPPMGQWRASCLIYAMLRILSGIIPPITCICSPLRL